MNIVLKNSSLGTFPVENAGVQGFFTILGWNYSSWHGFIEPPPSELLPYASLTPAQQAAADQLCYLPDTFEAGTLLSEINLQSLTTPPTPAPV